MQESKSHRRRLRRLVESTALVALVVTAAAVLSGGCSRSMFMQSPWNAIPKATPEEIAKLHEPDALRADLDAIVALHERTCPNPYLRVSKDSILALAERLKASIDRPLTRREFLPIVMEMQAGYRSDHYFTRRARNWRASKLRVNALASRPGRSRLAACVRRFATRGCVRRGLSGWARGAACPRRWPTVARVLANCLSAHRETFPRSGVSV